MPETYHAGETTFDEERVTALINENRSLLDDLEHGNTERMAAVDLARRARIPQRDGYPTSSLGGGSGSVVSDRTGETAVELATLGGNPDPTKAAIRQVLNGLVKARDGLRHAARAVGSVTPKEPTDVEDVCRVCAQPPVYRADRCRWCYDFRLAEGQDPPEELWVMHLEGRRITEAKVREVLDRTGGKRGARR